MSVPSTVADLSATAALNSPSGSESIGTNLDDYLRAHAAIIRQVSDAKANSGANADITSLSGLSGNLAFTGIGNRITGDFSNATTANRVMFQTSTANSGANVGVLANGTVADNTGTGFVAWGNSDTTASQTASMYCFKNLEMRLAAGSNTGTYLPMTFYTGGSERVRIDVSGNVLVTNSGGGLGYGVGSGGTVTQATSKSTAVTLNKPSGQITMNNASLAAGARASFSVFNALVSASDTVVVNPAYAGGIGLNYSVVASPASGSFVISLKNESAVSLSDAVVLNFAVLKGSTT